VPLADRVVDNRTLLLGLDELYRKSMARHERSELLSCARAVARVLRVVPADDPVEGYYCEDASLAEYFGLVTALRNVAESSTSRVAALPEFRRLLLVMSSPIYGRAHHPDKLLPSGWDPLSEVLRRSFPEWTVGRLAEEAARAASETDDISLVGLAARIRDGVVLAAIRESVVLYATLVVGRALQQPACQWEVDEELCTAAARFVDTFNVLFDESLPAPSPDNAGAFWTACRNNDIRGRCVRIGIDDRNGPIRHYHWAIRPGPGGEYVVDEFWDSDVWTTARYRRQLGRH
jgi:hypothetical protein